ncbi:MAG: Ig-like domain-containing protein [Pseudomonadota bacterium]|nr:Ig-like domain-containing protein [Pseudomonadota bacterium]
MLLFLASSVAFASCALPPATMVPNDGAVDVPVDVAILWATDSSVQDRPPVLFDAGGVAVPMTVTWSESGGSEVYATLAPDAPLAPGAAYTVADTWDTYTFTTGDAGESEAPAVPSITTVEADADYAGAHSCSGSTSSDEHREHVYVALGIDASVRGYVEARVTVDGGAPFYARGGPDGVFLAWGGCYLSNLPRMDGAEAIAVSVRAVAYDGVASDWGGEQAIEIPWPGVPDCAEASAGCASGATAPWGLGALGAMLAVGARRRGA